MSRVLLILTAMLLVFQGCPADAEEKESPCLRMARERVTVKAGSRAPILDWHAAASCRSSLAVLEGAREATPALREEICRREVLAGAHVRTCVYFRDELCPAAYEPCAAWVLEQYERCRIGDGQWFLPIQESRSRPDGDPH